MVAERDDLVGAQTTSEPYADVAETHSAIVFFAGDRAYKLKKPVSLGFLDFSTAEARAAACQRETELNRRFAPDVYLGVAEVRDPDGNVCDHLVLMRRMPKARRLSNLVQAGEPVGGAVRQVARILAAQHASARRNPAISEQGSRDAVQRRWHDNLEQVRSLPHGGLIAATGLDTAEQLTSRFLAGRKALFDARIRGGHILDGHGDLLAGDIFCLPDGPRILDCLDFDDQLRWLDGLDDASFLAMDLELLGARQLAEQFIRWYIEYSGDFAPPSLGHHYVAYRAFVRAKVACLRAQQGDPLAPSEASKAAALATKHLHAGAVTLVLIGGLPGSGKSTLAAAIADRLGFTVLSSDRTRKELAGIGPERSAQAAYGAGIYSQSWTQRTYDKLVERAARLLSLGESVIIDASWASAEHRTAAAAAAEKASADLVALRCSAPAALAARRMSSRVGGTSDADAGIAARMARMQAPWPEAVTIDTIDSKLAEPAGESSDIVQQALEVIRPHGAEHAWRPVRPYMLPS
jgi:uncharacterized protein